MADLGATGRTVRGWRVCRFHGAGGLHGQMHLAPLTTALNTMLAGLPFAIAQKLDSGAVNEQV